MTHFEKEKKKKSTYLYMIWELDEMNIKNLIQEYKKLNSSHVQSLLTLIYYINLLY